MSVSVVAMVGCRCHGWLCWLGLVGYGYGVYLSSVVSLMGGFGCDLNLFPLFSCYKSHTQEKLTTRIQNYHF